MDEVCSCGTSRQQSWALVESHSGHIDRWAFSSMHYQCAFSKGQLQGKAWRPPESKIAQLKFGTTPAASLHMSGDSYLLCDQSKANGLMTPDLWPHFNPLSQSFSMVDNISHVMDLAFQLCMVTVHKHDTYQNHLVFASPHLVLFSLKHGKTW